MAINILVISNYKDYHTVRPEAEIFIGLAKMGFGITIITYPDCSYKKRFEEHGIEVLESHPTSKNDSKSQKVIRETIQKKNIHILQLYNSKGLRNGLVASKGLNVKIVAYRGYSDHIHWYDPSLYFKYFHPRVDKIICNARGVKDLLDRQQLFGRKKAITINKGHDVNWYSDVKEHDIRKELNIPEDTILFINVANNRKMKGIPYLLQAFNNLPEETNIHLLLLGRDMDTEENLALLSNKVNRNKVSFLGFRTDALSIVKSADVFISSSITGESITKAIIEAMCLNTMPIITDIAGNVELVKDNGLIAKAESSESLKECILKVVSEPSIIQDYADKSYQHILQNLSSENTIQQMKKLYESLVD